MDVGGGGGGGVKKKKTKTAGIEIFLK